ncbi:MAG: hypothetical protein P8N31_06595 [Planctomycetota bacterium]|nr:hypothetical protein [Planctomycetota bacterium]MDG2143204.1 hypothetical protein [Planctomycetota bacterium]
MMKFTGTLSLGLGIVLGVPALTFGGGIPSSLQEALDETVRAIDVLTQVEKKLQAGAALPTNAVTRLTEPAILDARGRDMLLDKLRNEVGVLQAKADRQESLDLPAATVGHGSDKPTTMGPVVADPTAAPVLAEDGPLNLAGISTGISSNMRTAISMDGSNAGSNPAGDVSKAESVKEPVGEQAADQSPTSGTPENTEPKAEPADADLPEGKGYSANPLRQAQACFRAKRYQQGLDLLAGAPKSAEVTYWKARLSEKLGKWDHAIDLYTGLKDDTNAGVYAAQAEQQLEFVIWQRDFEKKTKGDSK